MNDVINETLSMLGSIDKWLDPYQHLYDSQKRLYRHKTETYLLDFFSELKSHIDLNSHSKKYMDLVEYLEKSLEGRLSNGI